MTSFSRLREVKSRGMNMGGAYLQCHHALSTSTPATGYPEINQPFIRVRSTHDIYIAVDREPCLDNVVSFSLYQKGDNSQVTFLNAGGCLRETIFTFRYF